MGCYYAAVAQQLLGSSCIGSCLVGRPHSGGAVAGRRVRFGSAVAGKGVSGFASRLLRLQTSQQFTETNSEQL